MTKSQAKILDTVKRNGEMHISWRGDYGQRIRKAAYLLQAEERVRVTDVRIIGNRTLAIIKAA